MRKLTLAVQRQYLPPFREGRCHVAGACTKI
jgi:hypothetical protein